MISRLASAFRTDPAGFAARSASAAREALLPAAFAMQAKLHPERRFLAHYGVHRSGNAGDTALFHATRLVLDQTLGHKPWSKMPVRRLAKPIEIQILNRSADAVVVGGGGLVIPDSVVGSRSGWQWNISQKDVEAMTAPLIMFAVGYNSFHGQDGFSEMFQPHIVETIHKAAFVGLRNHGSIRSLEAYLPERLHAKLKFQPCPTTVLSRFLPDAYTEADEALVSINLAFDRSDRRFTGAIEDILADLSAALIWLHQRGKRLVVAIHDPRDRFFLPFLRNFGVPFEVKDLANADFDTIIAFYRRVNLTLGMRGHGQMVPFGLGNMIFTLASHPKMTYFLNDIGHPEWSVDVRTSGFRDALISGVEQILAAPDETRRSLRKSQDYLYDVTLKNLDAIGHSLRAA